VAKDGKEAMIYYYYYWGMRAGGSCMEGAREGEVGLEAMACQSEAGKVCGNVFVLKARHCLSCLMQTTQAELIISHVN
jgi:hypothetical protein